jgi:glycosyltransferase involved in cell wall biosynthesis
VRICVVYDCLFPYTVGGAERWYRNVAERLAGEGHDVTYVTLRQWPRGAPIEIDPRVRVITAGPRMGLYRAGGRRKILPPLVFGAGVLAHLIRHGRRYDVVHTASFPYFSLLAASAVRRRGGYTVVVDWHEVWSRAYWRQYLGAAGGGVGYLVQLLCVRVRQRAFCFSALHAARLKSEGLRGTVRVLEGEYRGPLAPAEPRAVAPNVVFAGRLIPEKRVELAVAAVVAAALELEGLRATFFGDGPQRELLARAIEQSGLGDRLSAPGFVDAATLESALAGAMCMLSTSQREGYGMIVIEAAAQATPSVVVAGEDNAAVELVQEGVNGFVVPMAEVEAVARAIVRTHEAGLELRRSTARWFSENARRLSLESSLEQVLASYAEALGPASARE